MDKLRNVYIILIAHNLRSCHNIGSLLRTADGLGVSKVFLTGYTPYPEVADDSRMPHITAKIAKQIHKTALGAEDMIAWEHNSDVFNVIANLKQQKYTVVALEQAVSSVSLPSWKPPAKVAIIVGREVEGIEPEVLAACNQIVEIPMLGAKESLNVVQAAAVALYHTQFYNLL